MDSLEICVKKWIFVAFPAFLKMQLQSKVWLPIKLNCAILSSGNMTSMLKNGM